MKRTLQTTLLSLAAILVPALILSAAGTSMSVAAINPSDEAADGLRAAGGGDASQDRLRGSIRTVVNVLLFIIGAIAVIMIVVGGIKYVLSNGDSSQITSAKNTVLYSVIGLVVALVAYAIVAFVIDRF